MSRRGSRAGRDASKGPSSHAPLNAPFRGLRSRLETRARATPAPPPPAPSPPPAAAPLDDETLFRRAMHGVDALAASARARVEQPAPASSPRPPVSEDAEAL